VGLLTTGAISATTGDGRTDGRTARTTDASACEAIVDRTLVLAHLGAPRIARIRDAKRDATMETIAMVRVSSRRTSATPRRVANARARHPIASHRIASPQTPLPTPP